VGKSPARYKPLGGSAQPKAFLQAFEPPAFA